MSGLISRKSVLFISLSIIVGVSLFIIGPEDIRPGEYTVTVVVDTEQN